MPGSHVLHGVDAVKVLRAGKDGDSFVAVRISAEHVSRVVVIDHWVAGDHIDASDGVNQLDKAKQANPYVVVDVNAEVLRDRGHRRARSTVGISPIDLGEAARREVYIKVTRDREHRHLFG